MKMRNTSLAALVAALAGGLPAAHADTGVSDGRVSLPEGPGSLEGVGDNASVTGNTGALTWDLPIEVPDGFAGVTPSLAVAYSSSGGSGMLGMGWDLAIPYIERMTNRGLPSYDAEDRFVANGGEHLVRVASANDMATYRARFEKGFARYCWHDVGDGTAGYWTVESPDGSVGYFGATADGDLEDDARAEGASGVFRYHLVETRDPFGHSARYQYTMLGTLPHLSRIDYGPAHVTFEYQERPDLLSDARSGTNEVRQHRLAAVNVFSAGVRQWRYVFTYEGTERSGGLSRLSRIQRLGLNDTPDPIVFDFEYSKTLANDCGADCAQPYLVDMGELGVPVGTGTATLLDINGDALPDVVDSLRDGRPHRFFINRLAPDGTQSFDDPVDSAVGHQDTFDLSSAYTQVLDINGDGFTDLISALTGGVLLNRGTGDWAEETVSGGGTVPDFGEDVGANGELAHVRFFDYDNDRRIDILRSQGEATNAYRNEGEAGFAEVPIQPIGYGFADSRLELNDMNGDGLQDPVVISPGQLDYRLNLGRGRWTAWRTIAGLPFDADEIENVQIEDLNGDSISDIVVVLASEVRIALNRNGSEFQAPQTIRQLADGSSVPQRGGKTVLFADMNGNGSDDVVWIDGNGHVQFLEMFPQRPNLLTRITNGLGMVTDVTYTTSVRQQVADDQPWTHALPFAMQLVDTFDVYELVGQQHNEMRYTYRSGYYDGVEKQFRGFARVEIATTGDETQEGSRRTSLYDVGSSDPYRHGLLLEEQIATADGTPITRTRNTWSDCALGGVPAADQLDFPVRFVCPTASEVTWQERAPEADWLTVRTETAFDEYGNGARVTQHGIVAREGDEAYTESDFVPPENRWILNRPFRERRHAGNGGESAETQTFYDGQPLGHLTDGLATQVTERLDAQRVITRSRNTYDEDGNLSETLDADGFATRYTYDADGLQVVLEERDLGTHLLRQRSQYHPVHGQLVSRGQWVTVAGGVELTTDEVTRFEYDDLGRLAAEILPGDDPATPTTEYERFYGSPVTRVVTRQRSQSGGAQDIEVVGCLDGLGRALQRRTRIAPGVYEVSGLTIFNRRGAPVRVWSPHAGGAECDTTEPAGVASARVRYDALGRELEMTSADEALYGTASVRRSAYGPGETTTWDTDDTDPAHLHHDTPVIKRFDGLERPTELEYVAVAGQPGLIYRVGYDDLGRIASLTDPAGNTHTQRWDAVGRVIETQDADRGTTRFEYDDRGNATRIEDAAGRVARFEYDGANRLVSQWDDDDREGTLVTLQHDDPRACPEPADCAHAGGLLVRYSVPDGAGRIETSFGHDARQRPARVTREQGGARFDFETSYDNLGRTVAEALPDGTRFQYQLDALGRVVAVPGFIDEIEYDRGARITGLGLANGTRETWTYDELDRAATQRVTGGAGEAFVDVAHTWSRAGLLNEVVDHTAEGRRNALYTYDGLNRLTRATLNADVLDFAFDGAHNLVSKAGPGPQVFGGDGAGPHAVTESGALTLGYDAAGFLTDRGDRALVWDYLGRLSEVIAGGETAARHVYGIGSERLVAREGGHVTHTFTRSFEIEDGMARAHLLLGNRRVVTRESDASAQVLSDVIQDGEITAGDAVMSWRAAEGEIEPEGEVDDVRQLLVASARRTLLDGEARVTYAHHDFYDNVVAVTDAAGRVVESLASDPYGAPRGQASSETRRAYAGKRTELDGELVYFGERFYDSVTGRWISPDPLFRVVGGADVAERVWEAASPYLYNFGNPVVVRDDTGGQGSLVNVFSPERKSGAEDFAHAAYLKAAANKASDPAAAEMALEGNGEVPPPPPKVQASYPGKGVLTKISNIAVQQRRYEAFYGPIWKNMRVGKNMVLANQGDGEDGELDVEIADAMQSISDKIDADRAAFKRDLANVRSKAPVIKMKPAPKGLKFKFSKFFSRFKSKDARADNAKAKIKHDKEVAKFRGMREQMVKDRARGQMGGGGGGGSKANVL